MSKKQNNLLSEKSLIRDRMRKLEFGPCYISSGLEAGEIFIIVSRKHKGGRLSFCTYLVDTYCMGVKDTYWETRMEESEFYGHIEDVKQRDKGIKECSYTEAHNRIWGAIAFAKEAGITPCRSFNMAQYFLAEDDESVPLIEYKFGKDGKHFLVANSQAELNHYYPVLKHNLGDDFNYMVREDLDDYYDDEEMDDSENEDAEDEDGLDNDDMIKRYFDLVKERSTKYSYKCPRYQAIGEYILPNFEELIAKSGKKISHSRIRKLLSYDKESLRHDIHLFLLRNMAEDNVIYNDKKTNTACQRQTSESKTP